MNARGNSGECFYLRALALYHCTGFKGKCQEPYTREEVLEEKFAGILKGISFNDEVLGWVRQALR